MHYVSATDISKSYGITPLFSAISFHIERGDRIALVARNGSGKSTLLRILSGLETPDNGLVWVHKEVKVVYLPQEPLFREEETVLENIFHLDHPVIRLIKQYEAAQYSTDESLIAQLIPEMDRFNAWDFEARVRQILSKLHIQHLHQPVSSLSGGQRKRVALAKALVSIGDQDHVMLIMDEPTNHLDVDAIEWLETYLEQQNLTLLLVTHDRYFLDEVTEEIWELDKDKLFVHRGNYATYLENKTARVESDLASIDKAKNIFRKELEWIRKQPKARTTKSKSRIDAFEEIEKKAKSRVEEQQLRLQTKMQRLGGKIVEMKKVYKRYGEQVILQGFDYTFKKGDRIGVIGKNGVGKTTFLNLLHGKEPADSGKINVGETVVFGVYSQQGLEVKEDERVIEFVKNIAENFPLANGGYLSASQFLTLFLFPPVQQYTYLSSLSGGEKRRLHLLSILFRNPNFLILDEPTNDLDLPTLSVLENFLMEFAGCVVIVSHDRYFMDRLVDHLFVFEGNGYIRDFPGNYSLYREWVAENRSQIESQENVVVEKQTWSGKKDDKRLSYKEKREWDQLQEEIPFLEQEKKQIEEQLASGNVAYEQLQELSTRITELSSLLEQKEMRWLELSERI